MNLVKNPTLKQRAALLRAWLEAGHGPKPGEEFKNWRVQLRDTGLYGETSSLCSQVLHALAAQGVLEQVRRGVWSWKGKREKDGTQEV